MTIGAVRMVRRLVLIGFAVMGTVGTAAALWPAVSGFVAGLLVVVLAVASALGAGFGVRRVRAGAAWRHALPSRTTVAWAPAQPVVVDAAEPAAATTATSG